MVAFIAFYDTNRYTSNRCLGVRLLRIGGDEIETLMAKTDSLHASLQAKKIYLPHK